MYYPNPYKSLEIPYLWILVNWTIFRAYFLGVHLHHDRFMEVTKRLREGRRKGERVRDRQSVTKREGEGKGERRGEEERERGGERES